ncbi:MAG: tetratricopeptide repeat protein, partial [Chloroflexi bacterium]|nr:tetratricopeptide repeat protein [Chloroflexota bacterium]
GDIAAEVRLSVQMARLLNRQSRVKETIVCYRRVIRLARQIGDSYNEARACTNLGYLYIEQESWYRAEVLCCHALNLFEQLDNNHGRAHTENHLGYLYILQGLWDEAQIHLQKACAIWQATDDDFGLMLGFANLAILHIDRKYFDEAIACSKKALIHAKAIGEELRVGTFEMNIGLAYRFKGELDKAEEYSRRAEVVFLQNSYLHGLADVQENLGMIYLDQQSWKESGMYLNNALEMWRSLGNKNGEIQTTICLIEYELLRKKPQQARFWLNEVDDLLESHGRSGQYQQWRQQVDEFRRRVEEHM